MSKEITVEQLRSKLSKYKGVLKSGKHSALSGECCALELVCAARECVVEGDLSDNPEKVGMPDFRGINDQPWPTDEMRTEHMIPMLSAYSGWSEWSHARKAGVLQKVALRTIRELLPIILRGAGLEKEAKGCEDAKDLSAAKSAAEYAAKSAEYAAKSAEYAAEYAEYAAEYAAKSAEYAAKSAEYAAEYAAVLQLICRIWTESAL